MVMIKKEIVVAHGQFLAEGDGVYLLRAAASREWVIVYSRQGILLWVRGLMQSVQLFTIENRIKKCHTGHLGA